MILGKELDAINFINSNLDSLFKTYPLKTMNAHFELLLKNKLYKDAYKALDIYENKPYVSQEVEEFMRDMKIRISEAEHPTQKAISGIDEVIEVLEKSTSNAELARVLFSLKEYNFSMYKDALMKVTSNVNVHPSLRTYALIVMVENHLDQDVNFIQGKLMKSVNPSKLTPPFVNKAHQELVKLIHNHSMNDITLESTANQLLSYYTMDIYPEMIKEENIELDAKAFVALAKQYLSSPSEMEEEVKTRKEEIEKVINSTPSLDLG